MLGAIKQREIADDVDVEGESFTADLIATRRGEIQAFANALRNENLIRHVSSADGDETFGELIRLAVTGYGVSQKDLAEAIDVNVATVSRWVVGTSKAPRLSRNSILHAIGEIIDHELDVARS